jgi:hypothetical protein
MSDGERWFWIAIVLLFLITGLGGVFGAFETTPNQGQ